MTEDERSLLYEEGQGKAQIRYWFYPDNIGTETDGSIGVISSYRLLADVERMDVKISVGRAQRETIDHLNSNYSKYEKVFPPLKETRLFIVVKDYICIYIIIRPKREKRV